MIVTDFFRKGIAVILSLAFAMALVCGCSEKNPSSPEPEAPSSFVKNENEATGLTKSDGFDGFLDLAYKSSTEIGQSYLVKFIITDFGTDSVTLHLMNTSKYPLHYEFAKKVLGDRRAVDDFEDEVYYTTEKSMVAGTLVYYAAIDSMIALTFFPTDVISPEQVAKTHKVVEERLQFLTGKPAGKNRLYYMPSGSIAEKAAEEYADIFKKADVPVFTHAQLFGDVQLQVMNTGVAYGTLRKFTAVELDTAIVSAHDILMLETLPAEIPLVAGTISKDAQTPLSHVNLAAKARKTPNVSFNGNEFPDSLLVLCDSLVKYEVNSTSFAITKVSLEEAKKFWERSKKEETKLSFELTEKGLPDFDSLDFSSAKQVGVKAANLSELHKLLPDNSPKGFAVPFYHYNNFLHYAVVTDSLCTKSAKDCEKEGRSAKTCGYVENLCKKTVDDGRDTLAAYIAAFVEDDEFVSDARIREASLDNIQFVIKHIPVDSLFGASLDEKVYALFDSAGVRLRSSTNSEDLEEFNGAGLYKSVKATRDPKDLPSREIRKVWASVWSFKAFEERSLWNIDHFSVQMGVAVHKGYPDEGGNGVVVTQNIADFSVAGYYVNVQKGETSITNPEDNSRPEIFSIVPSKGSVQTVRLQYSSLSPEAPIMDDAKTKELYVFCRKIQRHFAKLYGKSEEGMALDIEFKIMGEEQKLEFKQARPYIL